MKKYVSIFLSAVMLLSLASGMQLQIYAAELTSGRCGESVYYSFDSETEILTISGFGDMYNYDASDSKSPFYNNKSIKKAVVEDGVTSLGNHIFYGCAFLTDISFSKDVTSIGVNALYGTGLLHVVVPEGVTNIGHGAFWGCERLESVVLPESIVRIEDYAFYDCSRLENFKMPSGVREIGHYAFCDCSGLSGTLDLSHVTSIGGRAFWGCTGLEEVILSDSLTEISISVFQDCHSLKNIIIPNSVTSIGASAFESCTNLECIEIPGSVTEIGPYAFQYCARLKNVTIADGVTNIGAYAFRSCRSLENVRMADSVSFIGSYAFRDCVKLREIAMPEGLSAIEAYMFYGCSSLESVTLPAGITSIGDYAFNNCDALKTVYYGGTREQWNAIHIGGLNRPLIKATVHYNSCMHKYDSGKLIKSPGCTEDGKMEYICTLCGNVKTEVLAMTGHTIVTDEMIDATCTEAGVSEGSHCSVCGEVLIEQEILESLGHKYDSGRITKKSTCTENGIRTYTCVRCGATKENSIAKSKHVCSWTNVNGYIVKSCESCGLEQDRLRFTDLGDYASYGDYVQYTSVSNSFIAGTNPPEYTQFSPQKPLTRAMLVAILYRMAGNPYDANNPHSENPFADIQTGAYYYNAACWALDEGITNQITFKPNDNVTREQTARFLFAYAEAKDLLGDEAYKNVDLSEYSDYGSVHGWAYAPLQWANYNDMITGTQQGLIEPQGATQRIHATRILYGFGKVCNIGNFA